MNSAKLLLHIGDEGLHREATEILRTPGNQIPFDEDSSDWSGLLDRIATAKPEVLLLDLSSVPSELNIAMRQLKYQSPRIKVVALHSSADPQTILSAMRAGANEFLHPPLKETLLPALERILNSSEIRPGSRDARQDHRLSFGERRMRRDHARLPRGHRAAKPDSARTFCWRIST